MKKLSILIVLMLMTTVGGVYATWTYTNNNVDVADEAVNMSMNLTGVAFADSYGTFEIDQSNLSLLIDPKQGTTHTTALAITGDLKVIFTPAPHAPGEIKDHGLVDCTYSFALSNNAWTFDDGTGAENIVTLGHGSDPHDIDWGAPAQDGTFTFTLTANELKAHILLTEFELDTKTDYDNFSSALGNGTVIFSVSDGITPAP